MIQVDVYVYVNDLKEQTGNGTKFGSANRRIAF